jgi:hypothetical protein
MNIEYVRIGCGARGGRPDDAIRSGSAGRYRGSPDQRTGALQLTVDDAVRRAVENNPELAIVRLGTGGRGCPRRESRSAFTPVFSTVFGRSSTVTPPSNFLLGDRGVDANDLFSSTGVSQRLPWGSGTWGVSWDTARTTGNNPISSFDPSLQSGFQVSFSQPLLKDRKIDPARQQYVIAKRNQETSELRFREAAVQTVAAVKQAYWTFKAALANVDVQQRSLELAQELARENRIRVSAGQNPPLDLVQAEAEVAQRRENLIRARTSAADLEDALRRLIVDPADTAFWRTRSTRSKSRRWVHLRQTRRPPSRKRSTVDTTWRARIRSWTTSARRWTFSAISACRTCGSRLVSRQRPERHAVPADRRLSRFDHRHAERRVC